MNCGARWRNGSRPRSPADVAREQLLLKDRHGRHCAERLCRLQDDIIRLLFEFAGKHLYPSQNPSEAERMAIVATGGYGRGLLAPGSDIDLLFLLPYKQTAWDESVAEFILYCLWDMGLKVGHATRSVDECIRQAKADMTIRTALLEARFLFGDRKLFDELITRFDNESCKAPRREFVAAKLAERDERHRRAGQSRYLVEPNVKDGKGGLRDLHTLFWIGKYVYRVRDAEELDRCTACSTRTNTQLFRRCEDFLWTVRCHMHFSPGAPKSGCRSTSSARSRCGSATPTSGPAGRRALHEALLPGRQGCRRPDRDPLRRAGRRAGQERAGLSRVMARFAAARSGGRLPRSTISSSTTSASTSQTPNVFKRDPVNLIRMFHVAQKHNLDFHPDAMRDVDALAQADRREAARR